MKYEFQCSQHGHLIIERSILEGPPRSHPCPVCGETTYRKYSVPPIHYHSQGFHQTDYDKHGDKLEQMNKAYEQEYGEKPPPPAKDVPRNASEKY